MDNSSTEFEERRRFFRIDDEISLFYKKIDENQLSDPHQISESVLSICSLSSALATVSEEAASLQRRIEKIVPEVADYLKILDAKIDLLAQAVLMQGLKFEEHETRNVNLSASGIAFNCDETVQEGDYLEIKLLLASCMTAIVTFGRVVRCQRSHADDSQYANFVGVDFINIKDDDREMLIKYVVKKQMQQIRDKSQSGNLSASDS
ncbi:MAG: PilZ domain-containing protein [Methylobacter sp.]